MKNVPIRSCSNPDDPRPWADIDLADGSTAVTVKELNGLPAFRQRNGLGADVPPGWKRRPNSTAHSFAVDGGAPDEIHVLAVTLDGAIVFVPESQQESVYYAHLAWYDPATGEWTRLVFTE